MIRGQGRGEGGDLRREGQREAAVSIGSTHMSFVNCAIAYISSDQLYL